MRVTLYMRQGCHLCEAADALLHRLGVEFDAVDIDEDADLYRRYTDLVPVVAVDGHVLLSGVIHEATARATLADYAR